MRLFKRGRTRLELETQLRWVEAIRPVIEDAALSTNVPAINEFDKAGLPDLYEHLVRACNGMWEFLDAVNHTRDQLDDALTELDRSGRDREARR
ncbi:hypothetical protein ACFQBY_11530 [Promicromonospora citrea]|uniref:Uncharacterized protein n=1 Tax=Promicromonospora citrea TaxID=43677 RepID=A0A8H9GFU9_9MICO|nr:hypothetical protein [Promicromonospora citrea]NNH53361.1 hypothetical protein [Promicromonospora citrea]GGM20248.1 hypothetical protein GCM10010102_14940 [Promicromonospora citrea]